MDASPVVLVTGAARRVGAAIAREFHEAGARVVIHYGRSRQEAEYLVAELNGGRAASAAAVQGDLAAAPVAAQVMAATLGAFGRLDVLVNNASSFFPTPLGEIGPTAWDDLMGSNLKGPFFLSQAAAPHLRASGGAIVNITDIHGERPLKGFPVYCAAKAGLIGLTRALAIELAPAVRVNAVSPGPIEWPVHEDFPAAERAAIIDHTLLKRIGEPRDIARVVRFLALEAPYVTGQIINVDGGRSAHL